MIQVEIEDYPEYVPPELYVPPKLYVPPIPFHQHLRKSAELPTSLNCFQIDMIDKRKPKKVSESPNKTPMQTKITQVKDEIEDVITSLSLQLFNQVEMKYTSEGFKRLHIKTKAQRSINWKLP